GVEEQLVERSRRSKSADRNSFGQMEFDASESGVSHKFYQEREEVASDIACGQVESAMEVTSKGKEVQRNGNDKRDCRIVESVEVEKASEVDGAQSEGCTDRYGHEDISEDAGLRDCLSKEDPDRDSVDLKEEVQRPEIAPN